MHQIQLDQRLYKKAKRRARDVGASTVDEFVADVVRQHLLGIKGLFPPHNRRGIPKRLAHADGAELEIKAGNPGIDRQLEQELARRKAAWLGKKLS
jgi:hypothetical protein